MINVFSGLLNRKSPLICHSATFPINSKMIKPPFLPIDPSFEHRPAVEPAERFPHRERAKKACFMRVHMPRVCLKFHLK